MSDKKQTNSIVSQYLSNSKWHSCEEFLYAIEDKIRKIEYHRKQEEEQGGFIYYKPHPKEPKIIESSERLFNCATEIEAMIQVTNSLFDVLLQIVNRLLLTNPLDEENVKFKDLKNNLQNQSLCTKLTTLLNSDEFQYIRDFCNYIKHRKLIYNKSQINVNFKDKNGNLAKDLKPTYWSFQGFQGKNSTHQEKKSADIKAYADKVVNEILKLLNDLNTIL
ncbi:MAG: hypothetical protein C4541_00845 [Candidatus Auribacter fodinae]|jgi:hypothetical protein|uniref:Cthe-2314-like HEPN domain-containing protein n=1 Tax=Candidatus Auribacter fodinae TaxID=2093366 RepID=A0A3A4RA67_9BACT|nr:MAG: hypothetical protein C4541_00845 [Candidatus Auribacter fodinae]